MSTSTTEGKSWDDGPTNESKTATSAFRISRDKPALPFLKLVSLTMVSFAIPVIYFLQASEIKNKESKNIERESGINSLTRFYELQHLKDSLLLDQDILRGKIKADSIFFFDYRELQKNYALRMSDATSAELSLLKQDLQNIKGDLNEINNGITKGLRDQQTSFNEANSRQISNLKNITDTIETIKNNVSRLLNSPNIEVSKNVLTKNDSIIIQVDKLISQLSQIQTVKASLRRNDTINKNLDSLMISVKNKMEELIKQIKFKD